MKFKPFLLLFMAAFCSLVANAGDWFVSPSGSPSADGTMRHPWDLQTALYQPPVILPGDTVWLRGGVYTGTFISNLTGAPDKPIIVRTYPGEWAVIDRAAPGLFPTTFQINGSWSWFWGFEVTNSDTTRTISSTGSNPNDARAEGIAMNNVMNVKLINLVVHDNGNGVSDTSGGSDNEIYGSLIYHNGWISSDRAHGDGIYFQNKTGYKRISDNILFSGFNEGINVYGSDRAFLDNFDIEGNILFNSGILGKWFQHNMLVGGYGECLHPLISNNFSYFSSYPAYGPGQPLNLGYSAGCMDAVVQNNYLASTSLFIANKNLTIKGNTFVGLVEFAGGNTPSELLKDYPGNTNLAIDARLTGVATFVRPNQYEPGRGNIAIFNWSEQPTVSVDLSSILKPGAAYEVRDAQNFLGPPLLTGTYSGGAVAIPMTSTAIVSPIGTTPLYFHTSSQFGAFVVVPPSVAIPESRAPNRGPRAVCVVQRCR